MSELSTTVSVQHKVNLGNYESADVFVSVSGVTAATTEDELDEMVEVSKIVFKKIVGRLRRNIEAVRTGLLEGETTVA